MKRNFLVYDSPKDFYVPTRLKDWKGRLQKIFDDNPILERVGDLGGESARIVNGFEEDIKYLDYKKFYGSSYDEFSRDYPEKFAIVQETLIAIFSEILTRINSANEIEGVPIPRNEFRKWCHRYTIPLRMLIEGSEKTKAFVRITMKKSLGHHSAKYSVNPKFLKRYRRDYEFKTDYMRSLMYENIAKTALSLTKDSSIMSQIRAMSVMKFPHPAIVNAEGVRRIKNMIPNHKGKFLRWDDIKPSEEYSKYELDNSVDFEMILHNYTAFYEKFVSRKLIKVPKRATCRRISTAFNTIPKWIRNMVTVDGELLYENDYRALHPNTLLVLILTYAESMYYPAMMEFSNLETNDIHQEIANFLNISRKKAKTKLLSYMNSKIVAMVNSDVDAFFRKSLPTFRKFLKMVKAGDYRFGGVNRGHRNLSFMMLDVETRILDRVLQFAEERDVMVASIHDAVAVQPKNSNLMHDAMVDIAKEFGVMVSVTTEKCTLMGSEETLRDIDAPVSFFVKELNDIDMWMMSRLSIMAMRRDFMQIPDLENTS